MKSATPIGDHPRRPADMSQNLARGKNSVEVWKTGGVTGAETPPVFLTSLCPSRCGFTIRPRSLTDEHNQPFLRCIYG
jgi:hypothetical protein